MIEDQVTEGAEGLGLDAEYPVSEEQVTSLYGQGWAPVPGLLGKGVVEGIRARLAKERPRDNDAVTQSYRANDKGPRVVNTNRSHEAMAWRDPFFKQVATSRRLASAAVQLMKQPHALLAQDISFIKPAGSGRTQPHQDYAYFPLDRKGTVTLWIALVDMSEDMGPLHYVEGSHLEGPLGLHGGLDIRETYPHLFDRKIVAGTPLAAGDAQAHWDLTVHGAAPNATDTAREAYVVRYTRTDTIYSGIGHPHFDSFDLTPGTPLADTGQFPEVDSRGLVEPSAAV